MTLFKRLFENSVGKGENEFSPFPTMFSTIPKINFNFQSHLLCCQQMLSIWTSLNPLPNDKMLDWFKFKAFEDDKISVT